MTKRHETVISEAIRALWWCIHIAIIKPYNLAFFFSIYKLEPHDSLPSEKAVTYNL